MFRRTRVSRRIVLSGVAGAIGASIAKTSAAAEFSAAPRVRGGHKDVIVVGAGVFGAWTAWHLRGGPAVLLLDAWGPAHARASSGGESRMTRTVYGSDEVYTRMAWDSLRGLALAVVTRRPAHLSSHGRAVFLSARRVLRHADASTCTGALHICPSRPATRATLEKRFPQIAWDGIEIGLYEPELGALMARRAVQTLVQEFVAGGRRVSARAVTPPGTLPRALDGRDARRAANRCAPSTTCSRAAPGCRRCFPTCSARDLPDATGSVLLRAARGRRALCARATAGLGGLQRRRHLLRLPGPRSARLQDRARQARPALSTRTPAIAHAQRRTALAGRARLHAAAAFPRWRSGRWWNPASASTRTARTATC